MTQRSELSGPEVLRLLVPSAMTGAAADDEFIGAIAQFNMLLKSAKWVPGAAVTANASNFTTLSVRNRTGAGAGIALPFSRSYAATNSVAQVQEVMTPSGTAADLLVAAGDVLTFQRIHTGTGLVLPAGVIEVTFTVR